MILANSEKIEDNNINKNYINIKNNMDNIKINKDNIKINKDNKKQLKIKHNLGQYFTTNIELKETVYNFILNSPENILEPSIGQGDLISYIKIKNPNITFDMYEIDTNIKMLNNIDRNKIIFGDFMEQPINKLYKTIIGNPPYVRTKKGNLYIDFIEKCFNLLDINGELIFIIPSDFLKLTSATKILNEMMKEGTFTHINHPNNEKLFEDASIDVIVFRYCKNKLLEKKVLYNNKLMFIINSDGLITFSDNKNENKHLIKDYFDAYVGLVSGKDEVYKNNEFGNINILNGIDKIDKYIYFEKLPNNNPKLLDYMLSHKKSLLERGIRKFNEKNWFEWGAPRNIKTIEQNLGADCIYVSNLSRKENIAFIGKVGYFGGSLIMLKPKKECDLKKIVNYLNTENFKNNFIFSGRFKIGHRQLSNSYIDSSYI
jgi:adenine-specific DNA-methyltransferase